MNRNTLLQSAKCETFSVHASIHFSNWQMATDLLIHNSQHCWLSLCGPSDQEAAIDRQVWRENKSKESQHAKHNLSLIWECERQCTTNRPLRIYLCCFGQRGLMCPSFLIKTMCLRRNMAAENSVTKLCDMRLLLRLCIDDKTRKGRVSSCKKIHFMHSLK